MFTHPPPTQAQKSDPDEEPEDELEDSHSVMHSHRSQSK